MSISEPSKITVPFADSGLKNAIPQTANNTTGKAGFDKGFPERTMLPKASGGIPPSGMDFNGILYDVTSVLRYIQAGGQPTYDAAFAAAIGGYPSGAVLIGDDGVSIFKNSVAGNETNPNSGGVGWTRPDLQVMELYRRSYAEAGYSVIGTFQVGFTYVNANDVGIDLATGKGYTGPAGTVAAGTNPASGGFVDVSRSIFISTIPSIADLRLTVGADNLQLVSVASFHDGRGVGGGNFRWYASNTQEDDGCAVIQPTGVSAGRWINIKRGRLTPSECGCIRDDEAFDNAIPLNRWAAQSHCIGEAGSFYSSDTVTFSANTPRIHVCAEGMAVVITAPDKNGVEFNGDMSKDLTINGLRSHAKDGLASTLSAKSNGFYISGLRRLKLKGCGAEGWRNSGAWWFDCKRYEIDDFWGWRNDWDGTNTFASGGDLVEWTSQPGNSKSGRISNCQLFSDASQNISVNSLSATANVLVTKCHCMTYDAADFTPKNAASIVKRHGITIGYNSNQEYGGAITVDGCIIRDTNWTGIYRSGNSGLLVNPCKVLNNTIVNAGLKKAPDNSITGGILFGFSVPGDEISNNTVLDYKEPTGAAYRIQGTANIGGLTLSNNIDRNSLGHGVFLTGQVVDVFVSSHRSINPAGDNIRMTAQGAGLPFGRIRISGGELSRDTAGRCVFIGANISDYITIKGVGLRGTSDLSEANSAIFVTSSGDKVTIRGNEIFGFGYGIWYGTYITADISLPWGGNQFTGTVNAHRLSRTSGSVVGKVSPNYYSGVTSRFSNGGAGSVAGTEELLVNGVPVT